MTGDFPLKHFIIFAAWLNFNKLFFYSAAGECLAVLTVFVRLLFSDYFSRSDSEIYSQSKV